jgi:hypothetical protein
MLEFDVVGLIPVEAQAHQGLKAKGNKSAGAGLTEGPSLSRGLDLY